MNTTIKPRKQQGIMKKAFSQLVDECVAYVSTDNNQLRLQTSILSPTVSSILHKCYPYLLTFSLIFILNFILTIVLLIFVLRKL